MSKIGTKDHILAKKKLKKLSKDLKLFIRLLAEEQAKKIAKEAEEVLKKHGN